MPKRDSVFIIARQVLRHVACFLLFFKAQLFLILKTYFDYTQIGMHEQTCISPLQLPLVCLLHSRHTVLTLDQDALLVCQSCNWLELITFPLFTQDIKHLLLWPCTSHGKYEACIHHHFNEFLTTWKGDIQLHLVTANPRRWHKRVLVFLMVDILTN